MATDDEKRLDDLSGDESAPEVSSVTAEREESDESGGEPAVIVQDGQRPDDVESAAEDESPSETAQEGEAELKVEEIEEARDDEVERPEQKEDT